MPVTLKDIAMLIGISRQAVAAALEGDGSSRVSPATREKVLKLARELNYVPNIAARTLKGGGNRTIGILSSSGMSFGNAVYSEVCHIFRSKGFNCLTMDHVMGDLPVLVNNLVACGAVAIIVLECENTPSKLMSMPDVPIVFCRTKYGYSDVDVDKEMIGYIATEHLIKHGHKKIDYLAGHSSRNSRREQGWARALKEFGVSGQMIELRMLNGDVNRLEEALKKSGATALFCSNDYLAANVIRLLQERAWKIPQDLAVVGCDGHSLVQFVSPAITTVIQPVHALAKKLVNTTLYRLKNRINGIVLERSVIQPRLWIGGSCGCPVRPPQMFYRLNTTGNLEKDYRLNCNASLWQDENLSENQL